MPLTAAVLLEIDPEIAVFYRLHAGQWTANLQQTGLQTARALARSLRRRRRDSAAPPLAWRLHGDRGSH